MKIVLSPNPFRDRGLKTVRAAEHILNSAGIECVICLPFSVDGSGIELPKQIQYRDTAQELKDADMLICFGGDGTILHAAKDASALGVPILGVNLGTVGFMAELEQSELALLSRIASGKYRIEKRMMLDVSVYRDGKRIFSSLAFNDAAITKGAVARMVELDLFADKLLVTGIAADGVVVATPTGSTAYSMSAGGPIVEPTAHNIVVTPVCPHSLSARSFVLCDDKKVAVRTKRGSRRSAYLSIDGGRAFQLTSRDTVEMKRSEIQTKLVRLTDRNIYQILNQKIGRL